MKYTATIEVTDTGREIYGLFDGFKEESPRVVIDIKKKSDNFTVIIKSEDSVALRAAFNSISKLLTVHEKMSGIVKNGKRD